MEVEHVATPVAVGVNPEQLGIAAAITLSVKVTFPDRGMAPDWKVRTAVNTTGWLNEEGFGDEVRARLVAALLTV